MLTISCNLFQWDKESLKFTAEASNLEANDLKGFSQGFILKSPVTGKTLLFYAQGINMNKEGELQYWEFCCANLPHVTAVIYNDCFLKRKKCMKAFRKDNNLHLMYVTDPEVKVVIKHLGGKYNFEAKTWVMPYSPSRLLVLTHFDVPLTKEMREDANDLKRRLTN